MSKDIKKSQARELGCLLAFLAMIVVAFFGYLVVYPIAYGASAGSATITVTRVERVAESTGARYMIYTSDEQFENTDSVVFWKWNSADVYQSIEEGKTYRVRVAGWRIPILSMFRNVLEVEEVDP